MSKTELLSETKLFIPICKVDEEKRLVYGKMTAEETDSSGEIWDYDGSKPYFEAWSSNAEKTSGGKSLGNLRSMHQPIAAGKLTQFVMEDDTKEVLIAAKVVDDGEWNKVLEGVYTGFSQGGRYVKRWKDPDDPSKTRYISDPVEVSLVDLPCLPTATFEYVKADGTSEIRKFTTRETSVEPTNEQVAARAAEMAKAAGDESKWADHVEAARAELTKAAEPAPEAAAPEASEATQEPAAEEPADKAAAPDAEKPETEQDPEEARKAARASLVQVWQTPDGQHFRKAADAVAHVMGEPAPEPPPLSPVEAALKAARGEETGEETAPVMEKLAPTEGLDVARGVLGTMVEKGLYSAGRALEVLDSVISLQCSAAWEAEYEKDGSTVPAQLADAARALGTAALAMAQEEIAEALSGMSEEDVVEVDVIYAGAQAEFVKGVLADEELMKAGARNSKKDQERVQKVHDSAVELGASCEMGKAEQDEDLAKRAETDPALKAVLAEREELKGEVSKALTGIEDLGGVVKSLREELDSLKRQPAPLPPSGRVLGKAEDAGGRAETDMASVQAQIAELSKTEQGQRLLAEAAIRASQAATLGVKN